MSSYRPIDSKREEFRKYLEKSGAMDALTKVLVMLYDEPEKPADALDYIRQHLGETRAEDAEIEVMKVDLEAAMLKLKTQEDEIKVLKERLSKYEPGETQGPMEEDAAHADTLENSEPPTSTSANVDGIPAEQPPENPPTAD